MINKEELQRRVAYLKSNRLLSESLQVKINRNSKLSQVNTSYIRSFFRMCENMSGDSQIAHCDDLEDLRKIWGLKPKSRSGNNTMKYFRDNNIIRTVTIPSDDKRKKKFRVFINPVYFAPSEEVPITLLFLFWEDVIENKLISDDIIDVLTDMNELSGGKLIIHDDYHHIDKRLYIRYKNDEIREMLGYRTYYRSEVSERDPKMVEFANFARYAFRPNGVNRLLKNRNIAKRTILHKQKEDAVIKLAVVKRNPFRESGEPDKIVSLFHPLTKGIIVKDFFKGRAFVDLPQGKLLNKIALYQYVDIVNLETGEIVYQLGEYENIKQSCIMHDLSEDTIDYFFNDTEKLNKENKKFTGGGINEDGIIKLRDKYKVTYCEVVPTATRSVRRDNE